MAIEGALGTNLKIDCTYVSEDVEFASYLESQTKTYGCQLIFSGEFQNILSQHVKKLAHIRQIDQIEVNSGKRYELYTFELSDKLNSLQPTNEISNQTNQDFHSTQMNQRFLRMQEMNDVDRGFGVYQRPFDVDEELSYLVNDKSSQEKMKKSFKKAFGFYMLGQWEQAAAAFSRFCKKHPADGPSKFLFEFMEEHLIEEEINRGLEDRQAEDESRDQHF